MLEGAELQENDDAELSLPEVLGGTWGSFVAQWCNGHSPGYPAVVAVEALRTVADVCPDLITENRSMHAAAGLIALGKALGTLRGRSGFDALLRRLRKLDQGAHAELIVASSLVERGLRVHLDVPCGSHVLDLGIESEGRLVYVEVTAPLQSEQLARQHASIVELGFYIDRTNPGLNVEIEFMEDLTPALVNALLERLAAEQSGVWQTPSSAVRFRRWPSQDASPIRSIGYPGIDRRAEKILRRKSEQLSMEVPSIVVIDVGAIGASVAEWRSAIQRMLQPTKNRRISAVVLFQSFYSAHLDRGYRLWWVIDNVNATQRVPAHILDTFASLDESESVREGLRNQV
jgi:hypothetical protein